MFPFEVDPNWYDRYWYSEQPRPKHRSFGNALARFAVVVALLAGGSAAVAHFGWHHHANVALSGAHE